MDNTSTCRHPLNIARVQFTVAGFVIVVSQMTFNHVCDGFNPAMWMHVERTLFKPVFRQQEERIVQLPMTWFQYQTNFVNRTLLLWSHRPSAVNRPFDNLIVWYQIYINSFQTWFGRLALQQVALHRLQPLPMIAQWTSASVWRDIQAVQGAYTTLSQIDCSVGSHVQMKKELTMRLEMDKRYESISPFEFKNRSIQLAEERQQKKSARAMLDAGRGNPNWIAAEPRQAFFTLGQFAVEESQRTWSEGALAGKPAQDGIAKRFADFVVANRNAPGIEMLERIVQYGIDKLQFHPDEWLFELVDGIIGDNYPMPDRMLIHMEKMVHAFILKILCQGATDKRYELFAVEGATAAMCYIFDSLQANRLLKQHDKVAIMVPIFPPYVEIPHLKRYDFDVVEIRATGRNPDGSHTWQYPPSEIEKLKDPDIKALFLVNPSNPPSVAIDAETRQQLMDIVKNHNPHLMIISDDVYSTFVDGFRSLMADLPYNTIGVYSLSKYFGVTGRRLGVIALHPDNVFNHLIGSLPREETAALAKRYASLSREPERLSFMDRLVADSRQVALNHTAGLSTPQQVQMALFAGFALTDTDDRYEKLTKTICRRRMRMLYEGLDSTCRNFGTVRITTPSSISQSGLQSSTANRSPNIYRPTTNRLISSFGLAENASIVLLNGGGFYGGPAYPRFARQSG